MNLNGTLDYYLTRASLRHFIEASALPEEYQVDWRSMNVFDSHDQAHVGLADALSEAVAELALVQRELERSGRPKIETSPLVMTFSRGRGMVEVAVAEDSPKLAGEVLFRRVQDQPVETFRPGKWLARLDELQQEGRQAVQYLKAALTERRLADSPAQFQAADDGELFGQ